MKSRAILYILLAAAILVAVAGFVADFKNTAFYGGVDLRNRVTAARVAQELKQDPYFYKWSPKESDRYLDPSDNTAIPVARVTVPPTVLLFQNLISALPYGTQRWIWFAFQWAALIASLALLAQYVYRVSEESCAKRNRLLVITLGLLFISGSSFWRLHVERGQIYVWYVSLFSAALYLYSRAEEKSSALQAPPLTKEEYEWLPLAASGLILGYLISLRPPFIFAIIPFLLYKKFKFVSFVAAGALTSVLITGLFFPFALWKSYEQSATFQGAMRTDAATNFTSVGVDVAEGMNIHEFLSVPGEDSSLQRIIRGATGQWVGSATLALLLVITTALLAFFMYRFHPSLSVGTNDLFLAGIAFTMLAELFIPAPRWPYADVIWLIPLALLVQKLSTTTRGTLRSTVLGLMLTGLMLNTGVHGISRLTLLGEGLFIGALLLALLSKEKKSSAFQAPPLAKEE
ncbi:MAG: glycosyltransferase 87 family protein [bacterium]|nr:glycosyltransferase 87 family protein [bacterium]